MVTMKYKAVAAVMLLASFACDRYQSSRVAQHATPVPSPVEIPSELKSVVIAGNVRYPQRIRWSPELTLINAIKMAGGVSWQPITEVYIHRGQERIAIKVEPILKEGAPDPNLQPGDQVEVP
jgi:hypothetical protein